MDKNYITFIIQRLEQAKRISGDIIDKPLQHVCSKQLCNPENEYDLIVKGFLDGPPLSRDIYLCRYKCHHICNERECNNIVLGRCAISGACYGNPDGYSNYNKNDNRTWHSSFRQNERIYQTHITNNPSIYNIKKQENVDSPKVEAIIVKKRTKPIKQLNEQAQQIVTKLLYSPIRNQINESTIKQKCKILDKQIQKYIDHCEREQIVIDIIHLMMLEDVYKNTEQKLEILIYNDLTVAKYANIIIKAYKIVKKYYEDSFKFETIALGVLYEMRQGYEIDQIMLFPSDPFLLYNLPTINDIPAFGFDKKLITKGKGIIRCAYNRAFEKGVSVDKISFKI